MPAPVDLYNSSYGNYQSDVYYRVRLATYGEDLGQTSWVSNEESREIPRRLRLKRASCVLEIGCGSGRYALQIAETLGCKVVGVDVNEAGIRNASGLAQARGVAERVRFERCDVSKQLPFADASFDAVFANDVVCHIPGRLPVLREVFRVLRPGGRFLFSDALVIGGTVSHHEIATRSSIGHYLFTPPGHNEHLLRSAAFRLKETTDTTENAATIAGRWRAAREECKQELIALEGGANFAGVQEFLACVHVLTSERRLLRYLYTAQKPSKNGFPSLASGAAESVGE